MCVVHVYYAMNIRYSYMYMYIYMYIQYVKIIIHLYAIAILHSVLQYYLLNSLGIDSGSFGEAAVTSTSHMFH